MQAANCKWLGGHEHQTGRTRKAAGRSPRAAPSAVAAPRSLGKDTKLQTLSPCHPFFPFPLFVNHFVVLFSPVPFFNPLHTLKGFSKASNNKKSCFHVFHGKQPNEELQQVLKRICLKVARVNKHVYSLLFPVLTFFFFFIFLIVSFHLYYIFLFF